MLQRLLIDRIENRILVGITMFVATMLVIGWVAINENARMESFDRQFNARAIERGARLYSANCATCHGTDGRGINGRAPGLNSPHLFGYDYFAANTQNIEALQEELAALEQEQIDLATELTAQGTTAERISAIDARLNEINTRINGEDGINIQFAALLEERNALVDALQPAVDNGYPLTLQDLNADGTIDPVTELVYQPSRLAQLGWGATLNQYIVTTLIHGRPTSIGYWPQQMVAWAQEGGGTMRRDQIEDLAAYIENWNRGDQWTVEDALTVQQYGIVPGLPGAGAVTEAGPPAGDDVQAILDQVASLTGDPARGEAIYNNDQPSGRGARLGCAGCHNAEAVAPLTQEKWDNAINVRLQLPQFAGYSVEQYLVESIVQPQAYIVPPYGPAMPDNFDEVMTVQDLADVLAYVHTFSTVDPYTPPDASSVDTTEEPFSADSSSANTTGGTGGNTMGQATPVPGGAGQSDRTGTGGVGAPGAEVTGEATAEGTAEATAAATATPGN